MQSAPHTAATGLDPWALRDELSRRGARTAGQLTTRVAAGTRDLQRPLTMQAPGAGRGRDAEEPRPASSQLVSRARPGGEPVVAPGPSPGPRGGRVRRRPASAGVAARVLRRRQPTHRERGRLPWAADPARLARGPAGGPTQHDLQGGSVPGPLGCVPRPRGRQSRPRVYLATKQALHDAHVCNVADVDDPSPSKFVKATPDAEALDAVANVGDLAEMFHDTPYCADLGPDLCREAQEFARHDPTGWRDVQAAARIALTRLRRDQAQQGRVTEGFQTRDKHRRGWSCVERDMAATGGAFAEMTPQVSQAECIIVSHALASLRCTGGTLGDAGQRMLSPAGVRGRGRPAQFAESAGRAPYALSVRRARLLQARA